MPVRKLETQQSMHILDKALFLNQKELIFFLFFNKTYIICCGFSLKAPYQGTSDEYPQHIGHHNIITKTCKIQS